MSRICSLLTKTLLTSFSIGELVLWSVSSYPSHRQNTIDRMLICAILCAHSLNIREVLRNKQGEVVTFGGISLANSSIPSQNREESVQDFPVSLI